jgi:peptidoglycan/LPS O-acetylase OafA/YrhL
MGQIRNSSTYFSVLDGIRGIAAILILIRHTTIFFGVKYPESFLAVDLFFVLSGVVIANAYEQRLLDGLATRRFAWLRLVRIYPLYILGSLLGVVGVLAGRPFGGDMPTALALSFVLIPYLGYASPFPFNGVSWSLFYEIVANFLYASFVRFLTTPVVLLIMGASAFGMATIFLQPRGLDVGWEQETFFGGFFGNYS